MKQLVVSVKSYTEATEDFKKALKRIARQIKQKKEIKPHFEISFDNVKDYERFVRALPVLSAICKHRPKSIYELAKVMQTDVSNLNKIILFLEDSGALQLKTARIKGRTVKTPIVNYKQIQFKLAA